MNAYVAALLVLAPSGLFGQTGKPALAPVTTTTGDCSPAVPNPTAPVTVNCRFEGMTKDQAAKQAREYADILNRIRRERLSFEQVINLLESIKADVSDLKREAAPRHLSQTQRAMLILALTPYVGRKLQVFINGGDGEAADFAMDFVNLARTVGLTGTEGGYGQSFTGSPPPKGIELVVNEAEVAAHRIPAQCAALLDALPRAGLQVQPVRDASYEAGSCVLVVGLRE